MSIRPAMIALRRFGLGARPGDLAKVGADPRGFVLAQFDRRSEILLDDPDLEPSHVTFAAAQVLAQQQRLARLIPRERALDAAQQVIADNSKLDNTDQRAAARALRPLTDIEQKAIVQPPMQKAARVRVETFVDEATVRFRHQASTDVAFPERLAMFWSNHFCIVARGGPLRGMAGAYEREAIRPHVLGRFIDMLKAVEQHPAMLIYLDNQQSIGPNSQMGKNQKKGLNENLARETLELHTLGVAGGYTQTDVTNYARIITGWTVANLNTPGVAAGKFLYEAKRHEPGDWAVLGKTYADRGMQTGFACLEDFAKHPATARHIARKLASHFVADDPPPSLVAKLEKAFRDTDGNLAEVTHVLVSADEAWSPEAKKLLPPIDLVVALSRSLLHKTSAGEMLRLANQLGQPLWQPVSPKGFPDDDNGWTNPSALNERLRIAEQVARLLDKAVDPRQLAETVLGPDLHPETKQAIARAENREQGLELLIMSPDFQRR